MHLDPAKMERLLALSDTELWATLRGIAAANGLSLPASTPSHDEMKKLRALFGGNAELSLEQARSIIDGYKNNHK
ncbi:MAG: hypothetical protein J6R89_08120 [Clostridia bacterium]|nr:hypothetical protein [Clostridia bacterium]